MDLRVRVALVLQPSLLACTLLACTEPDIRPRDAALDASAEVDASEDADAFIPLPDNGCTPGPPLTPARKPDGEACTSNRWPNRPRTCPDLPSLPEFTVALVDVRFNPPERLFYDLDSTCSIDAGGMPFACVPDATASRAPRDESNGSDNAAGFFLPFLDAATSGTSTTVEEELDDSIRRGSLAPMLRIEGWNGGSFDESVIVEFTGSAGVQGAPLDDRGVPTREWAVDDTLLRSQDFYTSEAEPLFIADGYVAEGKLVVELGDALPIRLDASEFRLEVDASSAFIVGNLLMTPSGPRLSDVTIGGRWPFARVQRLIDNLLGCTLFADEIVDMLRAAQDITANPDEDGMDFPCNALTIQFAFLNGIPVQWGPVTELANPPNLCPATP